MDIVMRSPAGSVMSELDSPRNSVTHDDRDSLAHLPPSPWTPLSYGSVFSPGTVSIGTPGTAHLSDQPPSVSSVDTSFYETQDLSTSVTGKRPTAPPFVMSHYQPHHQRTPLSPRGERPVVRKVTELLNKVDSCTSKRRHSELLTSVHDRMDADIISPEIATDVGSPFRRPYQVERSGRNFDINYGNRALLSTHMGNSHSFRHPFEKILRLNYSALEPTVTVSGIFDRGGPVVTSAVHQTRLYSSVDDSDSESEQISLRDQIDHSSKNVGGQGSLREPKYVQQNESRVVDNCIPVTRSSDSLDNYQTQLQSRGPRLSEANLYKNSAEHLVTKDTLSHGEILDIPRTHLCPTRSPDPPTIRDHRTPPAIDRIHHYDRAFSGIHSPSVRSEPLRKSVDKQQNGSSNTPNIPREGISVIKSATLLPQSNGNTKETPSTGVTQLAVVGNPHSQKSHAPEATSGGSVTSSGIDRQLPTCLGNETDRNHPFIAEEISNGAEVRDIEQIVHPSQIKREPEGSPDASSIPTGEEGKQGWGVNSEADPHLCQVCGDQAAGFHCGAYVCEACKKFFVRCVKSDNLKFSCPRQMRCEITRETRTRCQYCRYVKCLGLGMYKPGGTNVSTEIGHMPCLVCGAPSSGFHFGAITCEGCKGFFRRTVKERDMAKYECSRQGDCNITTATRNVCKYCRYQKCLAVGMKPDGSRIGRQPNAVKHATLMHLQVIKKAKGLSEDIEEIKLKVPQIQSEIPPPSIEPSSIKDDVSSHTEDFKSAISVNRELFTSSRDAHSHEYMGQPEVSHAAPFETERTPCVDRQGGRVPHRQNSDGLGEGMGELGLRERLNYLPYVGTSALNEIPAEFKESPILRQAFLIKREENLFLHQKLKHDHLLMNISKALTEQTNIPLNNSTLESFKTQDMQRDMEHLRRNSEPFSHDTERVLALERQHSLVGDVAYSSSSSRWDIPSSVSGANSRRLSPEAITSLQNTSIYARAISLPGIASVKHETSDQSSYNRQEIYTQHSVPYYSSTTNGSPLHHRYISEGASHNMDYDTSAESLLGRYHNTSNDEPVLLLPTTSVPPLLPRSQTASVSSSGGYESPLNFIQPSSSDEAVPIKVQLPPPRPRQSSEKVVAQSSHVSDSTRASEGDQSTPKCVSTISPSIRATMPSIDVTLEKVQEAYRELMPILRRCPDIPARMNIHCSLQEMWEIQMAQFKQCALATVKFSKHIPGFRTLPVQQQIARVQDCMYPVVMVVLASKYDMDKSAYCYFNYSAEEQEAIMRHFPWFAELIETFHIIGFPVQALQMDNTELSFLCALKFLSGCDKEAYERLLLAALENYCKGKEEEPSLRICQVVARLSELAHINHIHHKTVISGAEQLNRQGLTIPQLFQESFLNE